jgi:hypothetical protein
MSYMNEFRELVDGPFLTYQQQNHLLADLRGYLDNDDDDRVAALQLLHALRRRRDVAESIGRELDQVLQRQSQHPQPVEYGRSDMSTAAQAPAFFTPPPQSQGTPSGYAPPAAQGYQGQGPTEHGGGYQQVPQTGYEQPGYEPSGYVQGGYAPGGYQQPAPPVQPVHQPSAPPMGQNLSSGRVLPPHPQAVVILVLAILSFFSCGITGIVSLVMGSRVSKEIQARPGQYGTQNLKGAKIVAIAGIAVVAAYLIVVGISVAVNPSS